MALTLFDKDLDIIAKLDDEPNDVGGLSGDGLKEEFDKAGNLIKDYINKSLIPEIESDIDAAAQGVGSGGGIAGSRLLENSVSDSKIINLDGAKINDGTLTTAKHVKGSITRELLSEDAKTLQTEDFPNKVVPQRALADQCVSEVKMEDECVTTPKYANASVTRAKLANDALYSPVVNITASTTATVNHIGKHLLCNSGNTPFEFLIDQAANSVLPVGADFAVIRWMTGNFTVKFSGNLTVVSELEGILKKASKESVTLTIPAYGTLAIKKVNSTAYIIYGRVEVVE